MFKLNISCCRNIGILAFLFTSITAIYFLPCRPFNGCLVKMDMDLCTLIDIVNWWEWAEKRNLTDDGPIEAVRKTIPIFWKEWDELMDCMFPEIWNIIDRFKGRWIARFSKKIFIFLNTDFANYSGSYLIGCHTLYFITSLFVLFSIMWSSNNISIFIKLFTYLMVSVIYIFVLDLDPWGCFLIIVEFSAFFLLSVILNSVKLNKGYFFGIFTYRYALVAFSLIPLLFIFVTDTRVSIFFTNFYKSVAVYSNSDFFGIVVLLYSSTYLISVIVFLLVVVSIYIIIFFIKQHTADSFDLYKGGLFFFTGYAKNSFSALVDFFFIKTNPIISKWFKK